MNLLILLQRTSLVNPARHTASSTQNPARLTHLQVKPFLDLQSPHALLLSSDIAPFGVPPGAGNTRQSTSSGGIFEHRKQAVRLTRRSEAIEVGD